MGQAKPHKRGIRDGVLRRPPAKGLPRLQHQLRRRWRRLLEASPVWVVLFMLIATWCLLPERAVLVPKVAAGSIAARTYTAERDLSVANEAATRELQMSAEQGVLPVYDFDRGVEADHRRQLAELFETGRRIFQGPPVEEPAGRKQAAAEDDDGASLTAELSGHLAELGSLKVSTDQVELLRQREFAAELEDRLAGVLQRLLQQGVVSDKDLLLEHRVRGITVQDLPSGARKTQLDLYGYLDYPEQLRQVVEREMLSWDGLSSRERRAFAELLVDNCAPNLTPNSSATLELRGEAAAAVGTVSRTIGKGEVIVRKGERVDEVAARAVEVMVASRDEGRLLLTALGTVLLLAAATLLVWIACGQERRRERSRERLLSECLLLLMLHVLGARFFTFVAAAVSSSIQSEPFSSSASYTYAIPLAALALSSVLLYGRNLSLVLSLVFALLVGHITGGDAVWLMMVYALAGSLAAVYALDHGQFKQRSVMTRAGGVIGLVNVAALLALKALSGEVEGGLGQVAFDVVCGFSGGLLAAAVASFSVPIFENLLSIATSIKLVELANPNLPLLRRLAFEAPGTFQHSLAVANLAKSGCEAIEADSVLVNTGALYHDIGKIFRPQYFIENQVSGQNPHDKIQPSMSALILINHVKEGLELAHQVQLPQPIIDAIEQHHGSHLIQFFYARAKERCDPDCQEVREEEFRYPGPKPQSKEMGVLMLADAVEAASRTLVGPSRQKIRGVLRAVFENCLADGQLDHTDLTLGDLRQVEEAFQRVLMNIYHRRVDYPGFDFNQPRPTGAAPREAKRKRRPAPSGEIPIAELDGSRRRAS